MNGVIPYIGLGGRAGEAADFYARAFAAKDLGRMPGEDDPSKLMHCQVEINGGALMMTDFADPGAAPVSPQGFHLQLVVSDGDAWWRRAVDAGCEVTMPFELQFWGDRFGMLRDPFGLVWAIDEPGAAGLTPTAGRTRSPRRRAPGGRAAGTHLRIACGARAPPSTGASRQSTRGDDAMNPTLEASDWQAALAALRAEEKALTRAHDRLAAERRRLPWQPVRKSYAFETPQGPVGLADLFEGRRQLIVYHHMLRPADPDPCSGCGMVGDQIPNLAHLYARDTSLVFVSKAPLSEIEAFRARMGWAMPWVETTDDFNADFGVKGGFGLNVFIREGEDVYRTYFTSGRGVETLGTAFTLLDLTPLGRQETWEDAPEGVAQTPPYEWWRLHDEYAPRA